MNYKVVKISASWNQPIPSTNENLLARALNDHELEGHTLHSIVPVHRNGETQEFILIFTK